MLLTLSSVIILLLRVLSPCICVILNMFGSVILMCVIMCVVCTCAGSPGVGVQRQHTPSVGDQSARRQLCAGGSEGVLHGEQVSRH